MPLKDIKDGQRKGYTAYDSDIAALAKIVSHERKQNATYSEADGMRDAILEKAARIQD